MVFDVMDWRECEEKFIRKVNKDPEKIESIKESVEKRIKHLNSVEVNADNVSFIVEGLYEIIKELLVVYLLKNGLRSKNHQCLISYFYKNHPEYEAEVLLIARMSYLRNRLDYYGEDIPMDFYKQNRQKFENIIRLLKKLIR